MTKGQQFFLFITKPVASNFSVHIHSGAEGVQCEFAEKKNNSFLQINPLRTRKKRYMTHTTLQQAFVCKPVSCCLIRRRCFC